MSIVSYQPTAHNRMNGMHHNTRNERSSSAALSDSTTTHMSDIELVAQSPEQFSPPAASQSRASISNNTYTRGNDKITLQLPNVQSDEVYQPTDDSSPMDEYDQRFNSNGNRTKNGQHYGQPAAVSKQQKSGKQPSTLSTIIQHTLHPSSTTHNSVIEQQGQQTTHNNHHTIKLDPGLPEEFESNVTFTTKFQRFTTHIITLAFGALLCLVDASLVITKAVDNSLAGSSAIYDVQYAILAFFVLDIVLRMVALKRLFFRNKWMVIDAVVTFCCIFFSLNVLKATMTVNGVVASCLQSARIAIRLWFVWKVGATSARAMVSTNKQRYTLHGFDLDLTYITDRIIAMGLPSTKIEAVYRNPIGQVARFFNTIHQGHYMLVNLCSERAYPVEPFQHRVLRVPFDDHNPPPLASLLHFCVIIDEFLSQQSDNVVAIHCKGGKGRTGTMVAAWLLYSNRDMYAEQALKYFAMQRTSTDIAGKVQGVGGPSQKRYVQYFEELRFVSLNKGIRLMKNAFELLAQPVELLSLTFHHILPVKPKQRHGAAAGVKQTLHTAFDAVLGDEHHNMKRQQWLNTQNWSLLITHYPPRQYINPVNPSDARGVDVEAANSFYMKRYEDYEEFVFKAKPRSTNDATFSSPSKHQAEDSITFDLTSFYTQSLCLAGDLKFQVFRGNLQLDLDDVSASHVNNDSQPSPHHQSYNSFSASRPNASSDEEKPYCFCWFWVNTSFMPTHSTQIILRKDQIDDACKNPKVDEEFSAFLQYHSPARTTAYAGNNKQTHGKKLTRRTVQVEEVDAVDDDEITGEDEANPGANAERQAPTYDELLDRDIRRGGHHVIDNEDEPDSPI